MIPRPASAVPAAMPAPAHGVGDKATDPGRNAPVIDMHVHVAGLGVGSGCRISKALLNNWRYVIYLKAFGTCEAELRTRGDALIFERIASQLQASQRVDGAVLLALDQVYDSLTRQPRPDLTEVFIPNDFILDGVASRPEMFAGASVNPNRPDWEAELERVKDQGAVLIKWLPAIQHIDPSDPRLMPYYRKLVTLDLPLLVHTGAERSFSGSHDQLGDPQLLHLPLEKGVRVIAAHVATTGRKDGEPYIERLLPLLRRFENLFTDISSLTQLNKIGYLRRILAEQAVLPKLLYGSDYPLISAGIGPFRLVSPWNFCWRLSWGRLRQLARIGNVWDRDLELKRALGFPEDCFTRPAEVLKLTGRFSDVSGGQSA